MYHDKKLMSITKLFYIKHSSASLKIVGFEQKESSLFSKFSKTTPEYQVFASTIDNRVPMRYNRDRLALTTYECQRKLIKK